MLELSRIEVHSRVACQEVKVQHLRMLDSLQHRIDSNVLQDKNLLEIQILELKLVGQHKLILLVMSQLMMQIMC
jgi:hypothetical protein